MNSNQLQVKDYGWDTEETPHSHPYLLPRCLALLRQYNAKTILDIGTGNGAALPVWLSAGFTVAAMEPDQNGFNFSKKYAEADTRNLGVGDPLPREWHNKFDAVISLEVVEHLYDPALLAGTAAQAIKDRGIVIVSTPYHGYLKNILLAVSGKWDFHHHPAKTGGHIKFWSRRTLSALFLDAGFETLAFYGAGRIPFLWKSMILVFRKKESPV